MIKLRGIKWSQCSYWGVKWMFEISCCQIKSCIKQSYSSS